MDQEQHGVQGTTMGGQGTVDMGYRHGQGGGEGDSRVESWNVALGEEAQLKSQYLERALTSIRAIFAQRHNAVPFNINDITKSMIFNEELIGIVGVYRKVSLGEIDAPLTQPENRFATYRPDDLKASLERMVNLNSIDVKTVTEAISAIRKLRSIINAVRQALTQLLGDPAMSESHPVIKNLLTGTADREGLNSDTLRGGMKELQLMDQLLTDLVRNNHDWVTKLGEPQEYEDF